MVKLNGPILSLEASGSIGNAVTVSNWKNRHYLKTRSVPTGPPSATQTAYRLMLAWLNLRWTELTTSQQNTWNDTATLKNIEPSSAFIGENVARLRLFKSPTKAWPATEENILPMPAPGTPIVTNRIHAIETDSRMFVPGDIWGYFLFQLPTVGTTSTIAHLIATYQFDGVGPDVQITTPLVPGSYFYTIRTFTDDGRLNGQTPPQAGTVLDY